MSAPAQFQVIPLASIVIGKTNPRKHFDEAYIARLTESIKHVGVLSPLLVRPKGNGFELVAGECRFRAAGAATLSEVPCTVQELTDTAALKVQLIENLDRSDLHPLEEAGGYAALMTKKHGYTAATLAAEKGRSVKYIYDRVKLLDLIPDAQALFLADKITAGHAILLARLSPKDQERAIKGDGSKYGVPGLFTEDEGLFEKGEDTKKPVSVREFQGWIDDNVRFDAKVVDPMLFPETAAAITTATAAEEKIIPITFDHHVPPEAREGRTWSRNSWKRADKVHCDHWATGIVVIGEHRGDSFKVCVAKDKCKKHWGKEIAERERRAKQREKGVKAGKPAVDRYERDREKQKREHAAFEARRVRYAKARPEILKHLAATIETATTSAGGRLADMIVKEIGQTGRLSALKPGVARGKTAEDLVKHVGWLVLSPLCIDDWTLARGEFGPVAKALGIDLDAILDEHAPVEKPAAPAKTKKPKKGGISAEGAALVHAMHGGKPARTPAAKKRKAS